MSDRRVHLWPARDAAIPGVPAVELTVAPAVADRLLEYQPPAFTRSKPDWWDDAHPDGRPASDEQMAEVERFVDAPADEAPSPSETPAEGTDTP